MNCPENWLGEEFADNEDWIDTMPPEVISDIDAALAEAKDRGLRPTGFGEDDFPLPAFVDFARHIQEEMEEGRGFVLVRGLPMERYAKEDAAIVFWGLACHLGRIVSQNRYGDLIGHVRDLGRDMQNPSARFYETRLSQDVHNDLSDWISLMCLRQAKSEGVSTLASAAAIHDIMMAERPDLVQGFCMSRSPSTGATSPAGPKRRANSTTGYRCSPTSADDSPPASCPRPITRRPNGIPAWRS